MTRHEIFQITHTHDQVILKCTDTDFLKLVADDFQRGLPKYKQTRDIDIRVIIKKQNDYPIEWLIVDVLVCNGWQIVTATDYHYIFTKAYESQE